MYLAIDIQWCKYKKKLNYGKILGLPRPTPLSNSLLGVIVDGMHAAIQNCTTLHIIFFYFMQSNFYIDPHNHLPTLFIVCQPILLNKEVAILIVWLLDL